MGLIFRDNQAISINPPNGDQQLSEHGSDWLWAVTAIYVISFIAFFGLSFVARSGERVFHYLFGTALFVGAIAYFSIASDIGYVVIPTSDKQGNGDSYQIFFPKFINWVVSWPSLIISLGLLSGVSWATIFYNVALSWIWVISYLAAAFTFTNYKWGFFAFGTIAWLMLAHNTLREGHAAATRVGVARDHISLAGWLNLVWLLYPIAFGLSDGGNVLGVTSSYIFYGVLDVLTVPLLSFGFLFFSSRWDYSRLNIAFTQYGRVRAEPGTFPEKPVAAPATGGPLNGEQAA